MRVLMKKFDEPEKQVECSNCDSLLAYTKRDIYSQDEEVFGDWHCYEYIICPVCTKRIILTIDGDTV